MYVVSITIIIVYIEPSSGPLRITHFCSVTVHAGVWTEQPTAGRKPPALRDHTFTKIDNHRAVVFGGDTESLMGSRTNDTYVLDMETWVRPMEVDVSVHTDLSILCTY